jgi:hypothetical protein
VYVLYDASHGEVMIRLVRDTDEKLFGWTERLHDRLFSWYDEYHPATGMYFLIIPFLMAAYWYADYPASAMVGLAFVAWFFSFFGSKRRL